MTFSMELHHNVLALDMSIPDFKNSALLMTTVTVSHAQRSAWNLDVKMFPQPAVV